MYEAGTQTLKKDFSTQNFLDLVETSPPENKCGGKICGVGEKCCPLIRCADICAKKGPDPSESTCGRFCAEPGCICKGIYSE